MTQTITREDIDVRGGQGRGIRHNDITERPGIGDHKGCPRARDFEIRGRDIPCDDQGIGRQDIEDGHVIIDNE